MRAVIVLNGVRIEELARVIGVVARFLEPDGQEILIESPFHKFGVATLMINDRVSLLRASIE